MRASGDDILVAAKEGIFRLAESKLEPVSLPLEGLENRVELQKLVNDMHTGQFFGSWFYLLVDLTAVALIALSLSGVYIWYKPWLARRKARLRNAAHASRTAAAPMAAEQRETVGTRPWPAV